jgi:hypothetical protein
LRFRGADDGNRTAYSAWDVFSTPELGPDDGEDEAISPERATMKTTFATLYDSWISRHRVSGHCKLLNRATADEYARLLSAEASLISANADTIRDALCSITDGVLVGQVVVESSCGG